MIPRLLVEITWQLEILVTTLAITFFAILNMVATSLVDKCHKIISAKWSQFTIALCKTEANNMRFAEASGLKKEQMLLCEPCDAKLWKKALPAESPATHTRLPLVPR